MARGKAKNLGPWCRLYASILDNPKLERLSDSVFRGHIKMMGVATVYGGMIPLDLDDVAIRLRKPIGKVRDLIQVLLSANLLERTHGGYIIHDWEEMQFDSDVSTGRVKQFRERQKTDNETEMKRFKPVPETPDETVPDTEAYTDTKAEKKETTSLRSVSKKKLKSALADVFPLPADLSWARDHWAEKKRDDLSEQMIEQIRLFRDHHASNAKSSADWPASWRTWVQNAVKFNKRPTDVAASRRVQSETAFEQIAAGALDAVCRSRGRGSATGDTEQDFDAGPGGRGDGGADVDAANGAALPARSDCDVPRSAGAYASDAGHSSGSGEPEIPHFLRRPRPHTGADYRGSVSLVSARSDEHVLSDSGQVAGDLRADDEGPKLAAAGR